MLSCAVEFVTLVVFHPIVPVALRLMGKMEFPVGQNRYVALAGVTLQESDRVIASDRLYEAWLPLWRVGIVCAGSASRRVNTTRLARAEGIRLIVVLYKYYSIEVKRVVTLRHTLT
jgi:hypothetical protein